MKIVPIDSVQPNDWNPNEMDAQMSASLRQGLVEDGWLISQSLLIWGTDNRNKRRDVIIDGEHRWTEAKALGFSEVPVVKLDGVSPADARKLTIKLGQKRGRFNDLLPSVLRSIQSELPTIDLSRSLGFDPEELFSILAQKTETIHPNASSSTNGVSEPPPVVVSRNASVSTVPLFFSEPEYEEFQLLVRSFGVEFGTDTSSATVLEGLRRCAR